jgi:hypothetical protein
MLFNELVVLLSMNGLCYFQLPLKIVQENLRLLRRTYVDRDEFCPFS